jgi:F-type H+-transporting ATPase subunit gamma
MEVSVESFFFADRIGKCTANFSAFEVEEEALSNLREYSLANSLFWALAEGHACEMSSRRNAMDVCFPSLPVT